MGLGVVLGGGGPLGTAWYAGLGQGLVQVGFDFAEVDVFIGTSAGAVAGAWWASGEPPPKLADAVIRRFEDTDVVADSIDVGLLGRIYGLLGQATAPLDAAASRQICELAGSVEARDGDEDWNVKACAPYMPTGWPTRFRAVVVRVGDGQVRLLGPTDSISVARGVAASAAAPGIVSPVRIGPDLYSDGGARSATNADLAEAFGLDRCLVL